jgi:hypothetical protein
MTRDGRRHVSLDRQSIHVSTRIPSSADRDETRNRTRDDDDEAGGENPTDGETLFHRCLAWQVCARHELA